MKKFILGLMLLASVILINGCALDKYATLLNYKNMDRVVQENDTLLDDSTLTEAQKKARKQRNQEAVDLAREMAVEAGNTEEDLDDPDPVPVP